MKYHREWKGLFRQLVEARANESQLPLYAAVACGIRRSLDDWIPGNSLQALRATVARLGLVVEVDCVFRPIVAGASAIGMEYAPTTRAEAVQYSANSVAESGSRVHVVVSSRADWASEALASMWYSVAVQGRVLRKPLVDHLWLGKAFGYPSCCVDFFMAHNDWPRQNMFVEAAARSSRFCWEANCFRKFTPWMTIFHMPCAFDCTATIEHSRAVLKAVEALDPEYADEIHTRMLMPCLVLSEAFACAFKGAKVTQSGSTVAYSGIEDLMAGAPGRRRDHKGRISALAAGDEVMIRAGAVFVRENGSPSGWLKTRCDEGVVELPQIFDFQ